MKVFDLLNEEEGQLILTDVKRAIRTKHYSRLLDALANRLPPDADTRKVLIPILQRKKDNIIKTILYFMSGNGRQAQPHTSQWHYDYNAIHNLPNAVMMLRRLCPEWSELNIIYNSMKADPDHFKKYPNHSIQWDD